MMRRGKKKIISDFLKKTLDNLQKRMYNIFVNVFFSQKYIERIVHIENRKVRERFQFGRKLKYVKEVGNIEENISA